MFVLNQQLAPLKSCTVLIFPIFKPERGFVDQIPSNQPFLDSSLDNLNTLFNYPQDIRKAIYTTNAIESLNSVIRKAIKKRKLFPTDESARKVIYLAIQDASKKWTMPIRNWRQALNRFMIMFEDRLTEDL